MEILKQKGLLMGVWWGVLLLSLFLGGCSGPTTKPTVWKARDASFSAYQRVEIRPVFSNAGRPIAKDQLIYLREQLEDRLEDRNLQTVLSPFSAREGVLFVQASIVTYEENKTVPLFDGSYVEFGRSRETFVELEIVLMDKLTTEVVARITTLTTSGRVGYMLHDSERRLFDAVAEAVAGEIAQLMQPMQRE